MDIFSWSDGVKGNLNQALVSLCLVLCMLVVFISCCLGFISCHIVVVAFGFASVSQSDRLGRSSPNLYYYYYYYFYKRKD